MRRRLYEGFIFLVLIISCGGVGELIFFSGHGLAYSARHLQIEPQHGTHPGTNIRELGTIDINGITRERKIQKQTFLCLEWDYQLCSKKSSVHSEQRE